MLSNLNLFKWFKCSQIFHTFQQTSNLFTFVYLCLPLLTFVQLTHLCTNFVLFFTIFRSGTLFTFSTVQCVLIKTNKNITLLIGPKMFFVNVSRTNTKILPSHWTSLWVIWITLLLYFVEDPDRCFHLSNVIRLDWIMTWILLQGMTISAAGVTFFLEVHASQFLLACLF